MTTNRPTSRPFETYNENIAAAESLLDKIGQLCFAYDPDSRLTKAIIKAIQEYRGA